MVSKFIIYQLLPRLFGNGKEFCIPNGSVQENGVGKLSDIDSIVLKEIKKLSVTHIWLTGIIEHATEGDDGVKGRAGSPYAIKDYFNIAPYLCDDPSKGIEEFETLAERIQSVDLKLIIDFVPNHLAKCYYSTKGQFTDSNFYPGRIYDGDWSDTIKLNYSNRDTWEKMLNILLFWAEKGVNGFRVDMVELVPVEFWHWCIPIVKSKYPEILFIAEIYSPSNYNNYIEVGNFDYLYDKSGFYDTLRAIMRGDKWACDLTKVWQELGPNQQHMLNFLENHDEQRIGSDFFLGNPIEALPALYVSLYFNTAPFMIYFGQEFGEKGMDQEGFSGVDGKTSIFDFWSISTVRRWLKGVREGDGTKYLNIKENSLYFLYKKMLYDSMNIHALRNGDVYDLEYANQNSPFFNKQYHFAFLRFLKKELYLCVVNFASIDSSIRVLIPDEAYHYIGVNKEDFPQDVEVSLSSKSGTLIKL